MNLPIAALLDRTLADSRDLDRVLPLMDETEFRAFYERTARPLWSYLSRLTGDRQQADDLLQDAYYRFCRAGARHESEAHRRNSLFQIATNLARDAARRPERRHPGVPLTDEGDESGPAAECPGPAPERQAMVRTDLGRAMRHLDPTQRAMLWLAYAQGSSHEEIADILGLRAVSVRTLLLRARRKLAILLTDGPGGLGTAREAER
jgi:RNA polymerase sigma-70 factor, ECF subfamily